MKALLLLLLCVSAHARPTMPPNLRYGPLVERRFAPCGQAIRTDTFRLIERGARFEHVIWFWDGTQKRFIYTVPQLR